MVRKSRVVSGWSLAEITTLVTEGWGVPLHEVTIESTDIGLGIIVPVVEWEDGTFDID